MTKIYLQEEETGVEIPGEELGDEEEEKKEETSTELEE